jgi:hypothetical protein
MRRTLRTIIGFGLAFTRLAAQTSVPDTTTIALADRMMVASRLYAVTISHFALWDRVPRLDPDSSYRHDVEQAIASNRREDVDRATLAFVARLRSGHTWFDDAWLEHHDGRPIGFDARLVDGRWVIRHSQVAALTPGDVITSIDKQPTFSQTVHVTVGDMTISMATTEVYFANGAPFEGIGIAPDIVVSPTVDDIRAGRDPVLTYAKQVAITAR